MKRNLLSMSLMLASLFGAAQPMIAMDASAASAQVANVSVPDPAVQIRDAVRKLRNNDLAGLIQVMVPAAHYQEFRSAYEAALTEPTTDEQRAEFAEAWGKIAAPDAVEKLMAEIEPKLIEARPQAPGALMMGIGALQMAVTSPEADLTDDQRATLRQALPGIQSWVTATDFLSSESMRRALTLVADAARNTGISNVDQLKMLSLEETLAKAGSVLSAAKQAVRIYGLDLDAIADTLAVEVLAIEGDTARVRTTITVFNAPLSKELDLVLVDGRWYGKDMGVHFGSHDHSDS